jgi:fatty acid synthase, animal type
VGLVKCLRKEAGGNSIRCIFDTSGKINLNSYNPERDFILKDILEKDLVMNIFEDGVWGSYRHIPTNMADASVPSKNIKHAYVNTLTNGNLSSLCWIESPIKFHKTQQHKNSPEKLCTVHYSALNFKGQSSKNRNKLFSEKS